ncbi:MAG: site-specific DNA-methyltransferase [bacterium]
MTEKDTSRSSRIINGASMQNLLDDLKQLLQQDERCVAEGQLLKNKIIELALAVDAGVIKLLFKNKSIKKHFFTDVDGVLVFDKVKFQHFVSNKEFLPDSYTAFKNKIGLVNENGDYLSESREVVLAWPYKDCILEGGQTKEDQKRDEIFWNETLAPDEIDRLLAPKVFTNFKRYDSKGEYVLRGNEKINFFKENHIIKGNNLLALYSLFEKYAGTVKVIYIDPPYNMDGDTFRYNDTFSHSTWLSFMRNRLEIANRLLMNEGVIFIQIGDEEVHYLKVLCDAVFGRDNFINTIARVSKTASDKGTFFAPSIDFILCYAKNKTLLNEFSDDVDELLYKRVEKDGERKGEKFRDDVALYQSSLDPLRGCKNQRYYIKAPNGTLLIPPGLTFPLKKKDASFIPPKTKDDKVWRWTYETYLKNKNLLVFKSTKTSPLIDEKGKQAKWNIYTKSYLLDRQEKGTKPRNYLDQFINRKGADYIKNLDIDFSYSKPVELIEYLIKIVGTEKDSIILDFFSGSGTTAEAVIRINEADQGHRNFILCEQLDYIEDVTIKRVKAIAGKVSFNSFELMHWNDAYISQIKKAKTTKELLAFWEEMQERAFISYKVDPETINDNIASFKELSLADQKRFLIEVLDKNQLYVNYSEIDDKEYGVSETDKILNRQFYGEA